MDYGLGGALSQMAQNKNYMGSSIQNKKKKLPDVKSLNDQFKGAIHSEFGYKPNKAKLGVSDDVFEKQRKKKAKAKKPATKEKGWWDSHGQDLMGALASAAEMVDSNKAQVMPPPAAFRGSVSFNPQSIAALMYQ